MSGPIGKVYINLEDLFAMIEYQEKHDRFYDVYFSESPRDAIHDLLDMGQIRGVIVSMDKEQPPRFNGRR